MGWNMSCAFGWIIMKVQSFACFFQNLETTLDLSASDQLKSKELNTWNHNL